MSGNRARRRYPVKRVLALTLAIASLDACKNKSAETVPDKSLPPIAAETLVSAQLNPLMQPHWILVNDVSFDRPLDGRAYLLDADSGRMLGMVSGGYVQGPVLLHPDAKGFSQVSTYYSRGTRGERTDVVTEYLIQDLKPGRETVIPPKTIKVAPLFAAAALTDDGRFLLASNFTPAQSISVIDRTTGKVVGEFATPGCGLIYPMGAHQFMAHCSDGSLELETLDDTGRLSRGKPSAPLASVNDPLIEKPVRIAQDKWLFISFKGEVKVISAPGGVPQVAASWKLGGEDGWRTGGLAPFVYHRASGLLYVLMHKGGDGSHKDPGTQVWVYDVAKGERKQVIDLARPATTIAISPDGSPQLYAVMFGVDGVTVYEAASGKEQRQIADLGHTLSMVQTAPQPW